MENMNNDAIIAAVQAKMDALNAPKDKVEDAPSEQPETESTETSENTEIETQTESQEPTESTESEFTDKDIETLKNFKLSAEEIKAITQLSNSKEFVSKLAKIRSDTGKAFGENGSLKKKITELEAQLASKTETKEPTETKEEETNEELEFGADWGPEAVKLNKLVKKVNELESVKAELEALKASKAQESEQVEAQKTANEFDNFFSTLPESLTDVFGKGSSTKLDMDGEQFTNRNEILNLAGIISEHAEKAGKELSFTDTLNEAVTIFAAKNGITISKKAKNQPSVSPRNASKRTNATEEKGIAKAEAEVAKKMKALGFN